MRKIFRIFLFVLAMMAWQHSSAPAQGATPVVVTMMVAPASPDRSVMEKLRDEFNRSHPDIKFHLIWTDLSPKIHLLTAARALPDLITLPDFQLVNYSAQMLDLVPYISRESELSREIYPQILGACRYQGKLKMLPQLFNVPLLYYRPDLFRKAGIAPPNSHWTWEDYRQAAKKLTQRSSDGQTQVWGTSLTQGWWVEWLSLTRQAGGDMMDEKGHLLIGGDATEKALQFMHTLRWEDHSAPHSDEVPAGGFMSGKYAMHYGGHVLEWFTLRKEAPFEWDIAPLPGGSHGHATGEFAVAGWGIWKGSQHPEAAWEVLSYLSSKAAGTAMVRAGLPPVRKDVAREEFLLDKPGSRALAPQHREALLDSLAFARSVPRHKDFSPLSSNVANPLISSALNKPDAAAVKGIQHRLESDMRGYIATLGEKKPVNPIWFVFEVVILAAVAVASFTFANKRTKHRYVPASPSSSKYFLAFISPWIMGILLFYAGPLAISFYWSHTEYNIVDPAKFVGFAQYQSLFTSDPYFWHSLKITFWYALLAVPLHLAAGLGAALLLNQKLPAMGAFRTLFYLPSLLPVAASGIMWAFFLNPRWGLINKFLALFGITGPGWLYDPKWALLSLVLISLWGFGGSMLIFLAGLKNIPPSFYEAAGLDGASGPKQFFTITLPLLSPVIFFNLTVGIIGALQIFDIAYVVGSVGPGIGEPEKSTYFYVLNLFDKSFINLQMGLGSAMAWVLFAIILMITAINFRAKKLWVFEGAEA